MTRNSDSLLHLNRRDARLDREHALRDDAESSDSAVRHRATLELIAAGHYLTYSDARYAAKLALSGAHTRVA